MNLKSILPIALIAIAGAHPAFAQAGKSRAQTRAELDAAIRTGDILTPGEIGLSRNQLRPDLYPVPASAGKSRDQVRAETTQAIRTGDLLAHGESSHRLNEIHPNLYPPVYVAEGKTREQAKAELAEAIRTGDILTGGEAPRNRNELYPWSYQGVDRALAGQSPSRIVQRRIFLDSN